MTPSPRGLSPAGPGFTAAPCGVVGSSARAAVYSLARAGLSCWAVDQFADRDLSRVAPCAVCPPDRYPGAIPELAKQFPPGPVLYTGGLENHPHIVAELAQERELWGNPPDALARVRDPFTLFPLLNAAGFATPRLVARDAPCPSEGRWLRKPFASGGGIGIRPARPGEPPSPGHYFQKIVDGAPMSAVYGGTTLLGVTEQLIGEPWLHAEPFAYCGNVGPVGFNFPIPPLALCGVWGVDFVLGAGGPVVLEVNPRYTAAVEVIEHAAAKNLPPQPPPLRREGEPDSGGLPSFFPDHPFARSTCAGFARAVQPSAAGSPSLLRGGVGEGFFRPVGKAIYYAPHALTFPGRGPWDGDLAGGFDPWKRPAFADIPHPGARIERGWPVLTFFAAGSTPAEVRERLQSRAAELDRLSAEHTP